MRFDHVTIVERPLLSCHTSMGVGGMARALVDVFTPEACVALPEILARLDGTVAFLGEGTNIIAAESLPSLVVVRQRPVGKPEVVGEEQGKVLVQCHASTRLPGLLRFACSHGLTGLEGMCGIPGSVGGAVAMNAGSYGVNVADVAHSIRIFSPSLGVVTLPAARFQFAYRSCTLRDHSGWFMVLGAVFALARDAREYIYQRMRDVVVLKKTSQPVTAKSAGCVFKNPGNNRSAGQLLDAAGCKGLRRGDMEFSHKHANFLVNNGGGTFADALWLLEEGKARVFKRFGVTLEPEVKIWR